ncbi:MAG: hypothetical protein ACAI44_33805 [Candidatus Sericytochromatia bacterium]
MINLQANTDVHSRLLCQRQQEARNAYILGVHCLEFERKRGFQDKKILKQCCQLFAESIRQDRHSASPVIKLAYLMTMMQAWDQALLYVHQALLLHPGDFEALALQSYIQRQVNPHPSNAPVVAESASLDAESVPLAEENLAEGHFEILDF